MAQRLSLDEIQARTYKDRDAWWTVWLVDPLASRLVRLVAPYRWVTPNRLTFSAFLFGVAAAACYWQQTWGWLVAGAVLFHLSFVIDCMDGKIARLNGTGSVFGAWLDYVFDRLRVLVCAVALMGGQYVRTGNFIFVWLAGIVIFLDMFRYLNALQISHVKEDMKNRLAAARGEGATRPAFLEESGTLHPTGADPVGGAATMTDKYGVDRPVVDVYSDFRSRFGVFVRVRNALVGWRVRAHLFSGIEFQMFVFIVGPVIGLIAGTTLISAGLLVAFELLLILKLWTATRSFTRHLAEATAAAEATAPTSLAPAAAGS